MLFKFPCLCTKPFPACEKQAALTPVRKPCLANVTPFCQRRLFEAANAQAARSGRALGDLPHHSPAPLPEEHVLGPWAYLMPLKSEEEKSDILMEETQCGKAPIMQNEICS